jgi:hypothetical protein
LGIRDTECPLNTLGGSVLSRDAEGEIGFLTDKKKHGEVFFPTQVRSCFIIAFGPLIIIWALRCKTADNVPRDKTTEITRA